jgi:hypothetical protein
LSPQEGVFFAGTEQGLYVLGPGQAQWRRMADFPSEKTAVRQIVIDADQVKGYAATQKGLFSFSLKEPKAKNVFFRSNVSEMDVTAVAVSLRGIVYLGTKAGLFFQEDSDGPWVKTSAPFADQAVISLIIRDDAVYAATARGVFESKDKAGSWEKVFNIYAQSDFEQSGDVEEGGFENSETAAVLKQIAATPKNHKGVFVLTSKGIFSLEDSGNWLQWPLAGLDFSNAQYMSFQPGTGEPIVLTKTGVYGFKNNQWEKIESVFDGRHMAASQKQLFIASKHEILFFDLDKIKKSGYGNRKKPMECASEPTVQEVQAMAIAYAELSDRKIKDWRRRAGFKALVPEVSLSVDKTVYGSSSGAFAVGPKDWGVSLSWDLGDFIYNDALTSIDSRAKLMVELRNDILAEATRLYFERKKILMDLASGTITGERQRMEKNMRLEEVEALIDRLTGGSYTKVLKSL